MVNLGVIGRGSKRINVQPVAAGTAHTGTEATGEQLISGAGHQLPAIHVISVCRRDLAPCCIAICRLTSRCCHGPQLTEIVTRIGSGPAAQKPKRSLEDILGSGTATSLGFSAPVTVPQGFGAPAAAPAAADASVIVANGEAPALHLQSKD